MAVWENVIGYGPHAERPAPGAPGALYFESDTGLGFRDTGTTWQLVSSRGEGRQIQSIDADTTLTAANLFVLVTGGDGISVTLPDPAAYPGLPITIKAAGGTFTPKNPIGSNADE